MGEGAPRGAIDSRYNPLMDLAKRAVIDLKSTYDGQAWHGTPLRRILDGIDHAMAHERPIASARTIAELLAHVTAWIEIVGRRVAGKTVEVTPEMDFPSVANVHWNEQIERLERAHRKLVERVRGLGDDDFDRQVEESRSYTVDFMLRGLVHHNTYHAAQIAMLKKR